MNNTLMTSLPITAQPTLGGEGAAEGDGGGRQSVKRGRGGCLLASFNILISAWCELLTLHCYANTLSSCEEREQLQDSSE